jgi:hypothetical protein
MDKVIVKFNFGEISGFEIFDRSQWELFSQKILDYPYNLSIDHLDNYRVEFPTTERFMKNIIVESLTRDEYNVINNKIGVRFGFEMIKLVTEHIDYFPDGIPEDEY